MEKKRIINEFISIPRFEKYVISCGGDHDLAFELYNSNLLISKSFYPLLSVFEVSLRNRLDTILSTYFQDSDWILNQKSGFMSDTKLGKRFITRQQVHLGEESLKRKGVRNVRSQIVTELTLAFWVRLFQGDHFGLLKAEPKKAFLNIPRGTKRDVIHKTLKTVLDFRNRIYHNEPICFGTDIRLNKPMIDLIAVQDVYDSLYTALFWIGDKALLEWTQNEIDNKSMIYETEKVNEIIKKIGVGKPFTLPIMP
ncbi:MAG: hypothetical protein ACKV1O_02980 [Saprospiraceae bacterium]